VFVLLAAIGWISLWGLIDIVMQTMTREKRFLVYLGMFTFVSGVILSCPEVIQHL
jgi:hypothetical protein